MTFCVIDLAETASLVIAGAVALAVLLVRR